jgi:hypothetical protein
MADTANYGWTKPTDQASDDTWGVILNTALDDIDTDLKTVSDAITYHRLSSGSSSGSISYLIALPSGYRAYRLILSGITASAASQYLKLSSRSAGACWGALGAIRVCSTSPRPVPR